MKSKVLKPTRKSNAFLIIAFSMMLMAVPINWGYAEGMSREEIEAEMLAYQQAKAEEERLEAERIANLKWDLFTEAIIWQESRGHETSVGDSGKAVGVLQIWPIMVDEANRIQKNDKFTYEDRLSKERSIDIFNVIQGHYNKNRDYDKALRIWNPKHPESYKSNIMSKFNELQKENGIA